MLRFQWKYSPRAFSFEEWLAYLATKMDFRHVLLTDPCVYCGRRIDEIPPNEWAKCSVRGMTIDHIVPLSEPNLATTGWANQAAACRKCNGERGNAGLLAYLLHRSRHHAIGPNYARNRSAAQRKREARKMRAEATPPKPLTATIGERIGFYATPQ